MSKIITFLEEASKAGLLSISDKNHSFTLKVSFAELKKNKIYNTKFANNSLLSLDRYFNSYRFRCKTLGGKRVYTFMGAHTHSTLLDTLSAAVLAKNLKKKKNVKHVRRNKLLEFIAEASKAGLLSISDKKHLFTLNVSFAELKKNKIYNTKFTHKSLASFNKYFNNYKFRCVSIDNKRIYIFKGAHTHSTLLETLSAKSAAINADSPACLSDKNTGAPIPPVLLGQGVSAEENGDLIPLVLPVSPAYGSSLPALGHSTFEMVDDLEQSSSEKRRREGVECGDASVNSKRPRSGGGLFAMQGSRFSFNQMLKRSFVTFLEEASKAGLLSISDKAHSFTLNVSFAELKKNKLYNTKFAHRSSEGFAQVLRDCGFNCIVVDDKEVYIFQGIPIHQTLLETLSAIINAESPACLSDENTGAPILPVPLGQSVSAEENGDLIPLALPVSPEKRSREAVACQESRFSFNQRAKSLVVRFLEEASKAGLLSISDKKHSFTLNVSFAELKKNKIYSKKFSHKSISSLDKYLNNYKFSSAAIGNKKIYTFKGAHTHSTLLDTLSAAVLAKNLKKKKSVKRVVSKKLPEFIAEASKSAASVNSKQPQSGGGLFAMQGSRFSFNQMLKRSFVKFLEEASTAGLLSISDEAHSFTLNVSFAELKKNKLYNTKFAHRSSEVFAQDLRDCGFNRIVVDDKEVYIFRGTPIHQTLLETLSATISPEFPACLSDENTDAPIPPVLLGQSVSAEENGDLIPLVLPVSPAYGSSLLGGPDNLEQSSSSEKRSREGVACVNPKRLRSGVGLFAMQSVLPSSSSTLNEDEQDKQVFNI